MPGGSAEPVNRSITQPCNLLGCKTCLAGSDSRVCSQCKDGWQMTPESTCECAGGFGTYVTTAFETSLPYPGFTNVQPADECLYRIDNPTYLSSLRRPEHCSGANPRVIQNFFVDPPECGCRACPSGWASAGGPPAVTFCYPEVLPRYLKMEIELVTPNNYSQYDFTSLATAETAMDSFAQTMATSGVQRYGSLLLQPPTDQPLESSAFGVPLRETSIFATIYTFNGTKADLAGLISAAESCRAFGIPSGCASCQWDLCGVFNSSAPSSVLYRLGVSPIPTSLFNIPPSLVREETVLTRRVDADASMVVGGSFLFARTYAQPPIHTATGSAGVSGFNCGLEAQTACRCEFYCFEIGRFRSLNLLQFF